mmetsp:Transcript_125579/g.363365  ORF Transcript_125579/g.363365 Transcript_125579/m.363365 type:complete len:323 (+) Transcript_125579:118-1086(+)
MLGERVREAPEGNRRRAGICKCGDNSPYGLRRHTHHLGHDVQVGFGDNPVAIHVQVVVWPGNATQLPVVEKLDEEAAEQALGQRMAAEDIQLVERLLHLSGGCGALHPQPLRMQRAEHGLPVCGLDREQSLDRRGGLGASERGPKDTPRLQGVGRASVGRVALRQGVQHHAEAPSVPLCELSRLQEAVLQPLPRRLGHLARVLRLRRPMLAVLRRREAHEAEAEAEDLCNAKGVGQQNHVGAEVQVPQADRLRCPNRGANLPRQVRLLRDGPSTGLSRIKGGGERPRLHMLEQEMKPGLILRNLEAPQDVHVVELLQLPRQS